MSFIKSQELLIRILKYQGFLAINSETGDISSRFYAYCIFLNGISTLYLIHLLVEIFQMFQNGLNDIFTMCASIQSFLTHLSILVLAMFSIISQGEMISFIKSIEVLGQKLSALPFIRARMSSHFASLRNKSIQSVVLLICVITVCSLDYQANAEQFTDSVSLFHYILLYASFMYGSYYICNIMIFMIFIIKCFSCYLSVIRMYIKFHPAGPCNHRTRYLSVGLFVDIQNLMQQFSKKFGLLIACYYIYSFASITFEIFNFFKVFNICQTNALRLLFLNSLWLSPLVIFACFFGKACSEYENQINQVSKMFLLNDKMDCCSPEGRIFKQQLIDCETKIQAAGLFVVDGSFMFKVLFLVTKIEM